MDEPNGARVAGGEQALEILHRQHRRLQELVDRFRAASGAAERQAVAAELLDELDAHRKLEQEVFYPALRLHGGPGAASRLAPRVDEHRRLGDLADRLAREPAVAPLVPAGAVSGNGRGAGGRRLRAGGDTGREGGWVEPAPAAGGPAEAGAGGESGWEELLQRVEQHIAAEERELFPYARQELGGRLAGVARELVRGLEEFSFDYDDVVEGTFPASDPPATMAAPRVRTPAIYSRSRHHRWRGR